LHRLPRPGGGILPSVRRRLLNLLTLLSLLLCVAVVGLWVRSCRAGDWVIHTHEHQTDPGLGIDVTEWTVVSDNGRVQVSRLSYTWGFGIAMHDSESDGWQLRKLTPYKRRDLNTWSNTFGFGFQVEQDLREVDNGIETVALKPVTMAIIAFPNWFASLVSAALPAQGLYQRLWRKRGPGFCPRCGYDLRATPDRCPECGDSARTGG
jgi:hypothetical protein